MAGSSPRSKLSPSGLYVTRMVYSPAAKVEETVGFQRYDTVLGYRIISAVKKCVTIIQSLYGIAVKTDAEGNIRASSFVKLIASVIASASV